MGDFPNPNKTTTGKDGADTSGTTATDYTNIGWKRFYWNIVDGSYPTHGLTSDSSYFADSGIAIGSDGTDVTLANAKKQTTYTALGWNFSTIWLISENTTFPYQSQNPPTLSFFKVYTGTSWETAPIKIYTGTAWEIVKTKIYSGTEWG